MRTFTLVFTVVALLCAGLPGTEAAAATVVTIRCAPQDTICFLVKWHPAPSVGSYKGRFIGATSVPDLIALPEPGDEIASSVFMLYDGVEEGRGWHHQQVIIKPDGLTAIVNVADGATEYTDLGEWLAAGDGILE